MSNAPVEYVFCSYCREHAEFEETDNGEYASLCCDAPPLPVDVEPDPFDDLDSDEEDTDEFLDDLDADGDVLEELDDFLEDQELDSWLNTDGPRARDW